MKNQNLILVGSLVGKKWSNYPDMVRRVYSPTGISPTLCTVGGGQQEVKIMEEITETTLVVRKLTPCEYWKLMGFTEEDFIKAKDSGISNTQLYKQAGNSIVVPVLEAIFKQLFQGDQQK